MSDQIGVDSAGVIGAEVAKALRPDRQYWLDEWADEFRVLPKTASSESGRWRTSRVPYMREVMRAMSPRDPCYEVVMMFGTQLAKTESLLNLIGFVVDRAPCPVMIVQPTITLGEKFVAQRLVPMVQEMECLRTKIGDKRSRDSKNRADMKSFPGGTLFVTGANSAAALRMTPIQVLLADEIDGYPVDVDGEGDPVALVEARTSNFPRRKLVYTSTPADEGSSRIEPLWKNGDRSKYYVPCPRCGFAQILLWKNFKYEMKGARVNDAWMVCEKCEERIDEHEKTWMLERGDWIAEVPEMTTLRRSFWLNALYSPVGWKTWKQIATQWKNAQATRTLLKTFTNTVLAETWKEKGTQPQWEKIKARAEQEQPAYQVMTVPRRALVLTMGVDVQKDWIEYATYGWGREEECWTIATGRIYGSATSDDTWAQLDEFLEWEYPHALGGKIKVIAIAVDSSDQTQDVYRYCRPRAARGVYAIKGSRDMTYPVIGPPQKAEHVDKETGEILGALTYHYIGVGVCKGTLYDRLAVETPEVRESGVMPRAVHFPAGLDENYYKSLTAEKLESRFHKGFERKEWVKVFERNEEIDKWNYAYGMAHLLRLHVQPEHVWQAIEYSMTADRGSMAPPVAPAAGRRVRSSGVM